MRSIINQQIRAEIINNVRSTFHYPTRTAINNLSVKYHVPKQVVSGNISWIVRSNQLNIFRSKPISYLY